jgi:hypothetical protein
MKRLLIVLLISLSGCSTVQPIAESSDTFAYCKAADVATTAYGLGTGMFIEKNPFVASIIGGGVFPLIALSVALWYALDKYNNPKANMVANAITCPVAASNLFLLLK